MKGFASPVQPSASSQKKAADRAKRHAVPIKQKSPSLS